MIHHGFKVVPAAGTAVPLAASRTMASFVTVFARTVNGVANVGEVRLGGNPALPANGGPATGIPSGSGMPLSPGDSGVFWPMQAPAPVDLNTVYVDATNSNDGVQFVWGVP